MRDRPPSQQLLLLFVTRRTSGAGRRMESVLAGLQARERDRLRIERVDADRQSALVERLHVSEVPSIVLVKDRRPVAHLGGRSTLPDIEQFLAAFLDSGAA